MAIDFSKYGTPVASGTTGGVDFSKYGTPIAPEPVSTKPETDIGYIQRVWNQYQKGGQQVIGAVREGAAGQKQADGSIMGELAATGSLLRTGLRTAGAIAGTAFAPITEAPGIRQALGYIGNVVSKTPVVSDIVNKGAQLAKEHPEAAADVRDIFNIVTLISGQKLEQPIKTGIKESTSKLGTSVQNVFTPSDEAVQEKILSLFQKSIKPTAKKTNALAEKYDNSVISALRTIKKNADSLNVEDATGELVAGRTPTTIQEFSQALDQTKGIVFKQYDDLARQAGDSGVTISTKPIIDELGKVAENKALQLSNPSVIKYASDWASRLDKMGDIDSVTAQEVVKIMNQNLKAFYQNPTYETASRVTVDAGIANNFRTALDDAITGATGQQYQALKNQYGALKAIENDVVRASMREARKNVKGLLDYTDIFTGGQMVSGMLSLNPAMFTKGAIERGIKEYIRFLNDPNRAVKNMFDAVRVR